MAPSTRTYVAHQQVFSEGDHADQAFVVLKGAVEIYLNRGGKAVALDTVKVGECFGEMGPLTGQPRATSARTREPSELLPISADDLKAFLNQSNPLARTLVHALVERVKRLDPAIVAPYLSRHSMTGLARLLVLLSRSGMGSATDGQQDGGRPASRGRPGKAPPPDDSFIRLPYQEAVEAMSLMLDTSGFLLKDALAEMERLSLLSFEAAYAGRMIRFRPGELVENAERVERSLGELVEKKRVSEVALVDLVDLASALKTDPDQVLGTLVNLGAPRELFLLRKEPALAFIGAQPSTGGDEPPAGREG